jgi:NADPH:quinone reductase-like Zn-dependent oxidoreductase/acyl carrier protein
LAAAGKFQRFLAVEVPYHSPVMDELEGELVAALGTLRHELPHTPLFSTVRGTRITDALDARYWWQNVRQTVRFADALRAALDDGYGHIVEIGPHPVLATSVRDVARAAGRGCRVIASLVRGEPERVTLADALAKLHVAGARIDWRAWSGGVGHVSAPHYPWARDVHWSETERSLRRRVGTGGHPLVVAAERGPVPVTAELNLGGAPYLADHQVAGSVLFPAAGFVELALEAQRVQTGDASCSLENLQLTAAVVLRPERVTRVTVTQITDSELLTIDQHVDENDAVTCASGKVFSVGRRRDRVELAGLGEGLDELLDRDALYGALERRGLRYGPAFQAVERVRRRDGEVLAEIALPPGVDERGYHLHPVLLDAAFHSLIAGAPGDSEHDVVPVRIERVQFFASPGRRLVAHGRLERLPQDGLRGDLELYDTDGNVVASVTGFCCRFLPRASSEVDAALRSRLYARVWRQVQAAPADRGRCIVLGGDQVLRPDEPILAATSLVRVADIAALQRELTREPARVIDLRWCRAWPLGSDPVADGTAAAAQLLETLQGLAPGAVDRYYLVTTAAEVVVPGDRAAPACAPLLGLARTAMSERPDLKLTLVDLDPAAPPFGGATGGAQVPAVDRAPVAPQFVDLAPMPDALVACVEVAGAEQELAWRDQRLWAVRIERAALAEPAAHAPRADEPASPGATYELVLGGGGDPFDALGFAACDRRAPGAGEIEIEVEAVSLGFKDVMKVLDLVSDATKRNTYTGSAIGMEGTGRVVAVGPDVIELAVGDRVYGVAPAFLRSHMTLPATRAVKLPDYLSFEQGANLIAWLTAYHGLVRVAALQPGETVLVHSAAGGVGLAAIAVARWCGARVLATAGTDDKRAYLRELGIEHVGSSRDLSFADDVRAWTGGRGVDVVLNFTPGETVAKGVACLAPYGRFIEIGKASFDQDAALRLAPFNENLVYASVDFDRLLAGRPNEVRTLYGEVIERFDAGDFTSSPFTSFPASRVSDAFRTFARARHIGKIVVTMRDPALRLRPCRQRARLDSNGTYLVSGGLGGFGLETARWLANQGARHLVLASRRGAQSLEAGDTIDALRDQGIDVRAVAVDVASLDELSRLFADLRLALPPLRGIVHSAAVFDDRPLAELDRDALQHVMAAKARGAWNLHVLSQEHDLEFFVCFSSISSLIGNAGQGNYVAANAFLDQLVRHRRQQGLPALSVQWGALGGSGIVARDREVARHLERLGLHPLSNRDALDALGRLLEGGHEEVAVADIDWGRFAGMVHEWAGAARVSSLFAGVEAACAADDMLEGRFAHLDEGERRGLVEATLRRLVTRVMGIAEDALEQRQPLRDVGLDSIMALEIATGIESDLGVKLPTMELAGGPSLSELNDLVLGHVRRVLPPAQGAA